MKSLVFDRYYSVIALGDFNFPSIQWIEGSRFTCSSSGDDFGFTSLLMDLYLFQLVEQLTRGNNILDLVLTNTPTFVSEPRTGPSLCDIGLSSDHHPVLFDFEIDVNIKESARLKRFDFKNADFEFLKHALLLTPLSNGCTTSTPLKTLILSGNYGMTLLLLHWTPMFQRLTVNALIVHRGFLLN